MRRRGFSLFQILTGTGAALVASLWLTGVASADTAPTLPTTSTPGVSSTIQSNNSSSTVSSTTTSSTKIGEAVVALGPSDNGGKGGSALTVVVGPVIPVDTASAKPDTGAATIPTVTNRPASPVNSPSNSQLDSATVTSNQAGVPSTTVVPSPSSTATTTHANGGVTAATSALIGQRLASLRIVPVFSELGTASAVIAMAQPVAATKAHTPLANAPVRPTGIFTQLSLLLSHLTVPLTTMIGGLVFAVPAGSLFALATMQLSAVLLSLTLVVGYIAYLRRSGFAHAPRGDADNLAFVTPLLMGFSAVAVRGSLGGPFLVGSDVQIQYKGSQCK